MHHPRPIHLHRRSGAHERHRYARRAWPAHIRIAAVVAGCLIAEAILAKNVMNVTVNMVAFPL